MHTEIGGNLGAEIIQAMGGLEKVQELVATSPHVPHTDDRLQRLPTTGLCVVGITLLSAPDKVTIDATESQHTGQLLVGPEAVDAGLLGHEQFVRQLRVYDIVLNRFRVDMTKGTITRGSLVNDPTATYVCPNPACREVYRLNPPGLKALRRKQGRAKPCCWMCQKTLPPLTPAEQVQAAAGNFDPMSRVELRWQPTKQPKLGVDEPRVQRLYEEFMSFRGRAQRETYGLIPRVFGAYPEDQAPGLPFLAHPTDKRLQTIIEREAEHGMVIRPYPVVEKSGQLPYGLVMESTTDETGKPGMAVGWLSEATLSGNRLADDPEYGFTVRLMSKRRRGRRGATV